MSIPYQRRPLDVSLSLLWSMVTVGKTKQIILLQVDFGVTPHRGAGHCRVVPSSVLLVSHLKRSTVDDAFAVATLTSQGIPWTRKLSPFYDFHWFAWNSHWVIAILHYGVWFQGQLCTSDRLALCGISFFSFVARMRSTMICLLGRRKVSMMLYQLSLRYTRTGK